MGLSICAAPRVKTSGTVNFIAISARQQVGDTDYAALSGIQRTIHINVD
ncbi:hypothetical protein FHU29_000060 [Hoyosella altamirensis]|uniref:Uncharacterized protein n=1 Tax=Hoyosella altamirensis TaxID=616997 RepID=A0A839RHH6_9ACTN|nr:hypothetical protein [Hoyosella altamirensis]